MQEFLDATLSLQGPVWLKFDKVQSICHSTNPSLYYSPQVPVCLTFCMS